MQHPAAVPDGGDNVAAIDEAVTGVMRGRFNLEVPEEHERMVRMVQTTVPRGTRIELIRAAVRRAVSSRRAATPASAGYVTLADGAQLESGPGGDRDAAMMLVVDDEVDRVLENLTTAIKDSLRSRSYVGDSHPDADEWFVCVRVRYHVAAAQAIEDEVRGTFQRKWSVQKPLRPYYRNHLRYNVSASLIRDPKEVFITAFFFQWLQDPGSLPPPRQNE